MPTGAITLSLEDIPSSEKLESYISTDHVNSIMGVILFLSGYGLKLFLRHYVFLEPKKDLCIAH